MTSMNVKKQKINNSRWRWCKIWKSKNFFIQYNIYEAWNQQNSNKYHNIDPCRIIKFSLSCYDVKKCVLEGYRLSHFNKSTF